MADKNQTDTMQWAEKVDLLCAQIRSPPASKAIGDFIAALLDGIEEHIVSCSFKDGMLVISLRHTLRSTIATRSRIPAEWELHPDLKFSVAADIAEDVRLSIHGWDMVPLEGVTEVWKALVPVWTEANASTPEQKQSVAWDWWANKGFGERYRSTKLWRLVDSLASLGFGKVVPPYECSTILFGCLLTSRQRMTTLHYRTLPFGELNVVAEHDNTDDPDGPSKGEMGTMMFQQILNSPSKKKMGRTLSPSAFNFGALIAATKTQEGASPEAVMKIVTRGRCLGGATRLERLKVGAPAWQANDITFKMTGSDGRVMWQKVDNKERDDQTKSGTETMAGDTIGGGSDIGSSSNDADYNSSDDDVFCDALETLEVSG